MESDLMDLPALLVDHMPEHEIIQRQIREACAEIQSHWGASEERRRRTQSIEPLDMLELFQCE